MTNINETRLSDIAERKANVLISKYTNNEHVTALEFKHRAENDGWWFDINYNNWNSGENVTFRYKRGDETLYVEYQLSKNSYYDGETTDSELSRINIICGGEYYSVSRTNNENKINKNMKKQTIKLNESQLRGLIKESIKAILNENAFESSRWMEIIEEIHRLATELKELANAEDTPMTSGKLDLLEAAQSILKITTTFGGNIGLSSMINEDEENTMSQEELDFRKSLSPNYDQSKLDYRGKLSNGNTLIMYRDILFEVTPKGKLIRVGG